MAGKASLTPQIRIIGARQNNLKNLNVDIATGSLTVVTGPSGSGKSSLAFDTLYAEGQRRYVETFSPYARQFLDRCDRPKVDRIDGVPPAIAIDQTGSVKTSRSTVGTMTELNDYLKELFAREAKLFCPSCGRHIYEMSPADIWNEIKEKAAQTGDPRLLITFSALVPDSISTEEATAALNAQGFTRIHKEEKVKTGTILTVIADRFRASKATQARGVEAVETALKNAKGEFAGRLNVYAVGDSADAPETRWSFVRALACPDCLTHFTAPTPARFSFNSAVGACTTCHGFGRVIGVDYGLVIPDESLSLHNCAVKPFQPKGAYGDCYTDLLRFGRREKIRLNVPYRDLTQAEKDWVIYGSPKWKSGWKREWYGVKRFFDWLETQSYKMHVRVLLSRYRSYTVCPDCAGSRLKPEGTYWRLGSKPAADEALSESASQHGTYQRFVPVGHRHQRELFSRLPGLTIHDVMLLPVCRLASFFQRLESEITDEPGLLILKEIRARISYLMDVGLGYLTLDRQSRTLSGGEVQRVSLTTALGTNLTDTLFVLDEPSIGLHPKDMDRVNAIMQGIKNAGNTLVVVEHDPQVMVNADRILDMGPGSGEKGGEIVFDGTVAQLKKSDSLTGLYLTGRLRVDTELSQVHPGSFRHWLKVRGACEHNLKNLDIDIPLGTITTVTGVSGSGKSTLVTDVIVPAVMRKLGKVADAPKLTDIQGTECLSEVLFVDQSEIGKTTRSNPISYVEGFGAIRELFGQAPLSIARGYTAGSFSFNSGDGRCPTCQGTGFERVEMQFLSDVFLRCPDCDGTRYRPEIREVTINLTGKRAVSIADVLEMTVDEAVSYFFCVSKLVKILKPLQEVGLGYLKLGQPVTTLSGGELQRLKLAGLLSEAAVSRTMSGRLFVFDEPTTGLHFDDITKLMRTLRRLVSLGNTVLLVEHNLDVINASDWILDLGPEGGDEGGTLVAAATPDDLAKNSASYTGRALCAYREVLAGERKTMQGLFGAATQKAQVVGRSLQSVWRKARNGDTGIFGAREHNLKNIDVVIPKNRFTAVTGVSGSGKSTLAFGIVFAEGQRRYLESINAYARSMVQPAGRPEVDRVVGIAPTVAIEQRTSRGGRKSTVATLTEIQHFLRLLYVKLGVQHCPDCGVPVKEQTAEAIFSSILRDFKGKYISLLAPLVLERKGIYTDLAAQVERAGYLNLRVDGRWVRTDNFPSLSRYRVHTIELPTDSLTVQANSEASLRLALGRALEKGSGLVTVVSESLALNSTTDAKGTIKTYSTKRACPECGRSFPELDPRLFSYNNKIGWCPACKGSGFALTESEFSLEDDQSVELEMSEKDHELCPECQGQRLNEVARSVLFQGMSIAQITAKTVDDALDALCSIKLKGREKAVGSDAVAEIVSRLKFLQKVGLGYMALDRAAPTLSGGEAQRIRLASQLGTNLQGVCYVLDEPTIGLHARDNTKLVSSLIDLKNKGNTVVVVEHDEETIRRADHIIDIGPGAGSRGGELICEGSLKQIMSSGRSVTGKYLAHPLPHNGKTRHPVKKITPRLELCDATLHNLKNLTASFPLGRLIALTGVSGSGKSTLARDVLLPTLQNALQSKKEKTRLFPVGCTDIKNFDSVERVLEVDQTPIGKTPRSCPATYVGFFTAIRNIFTSATEAQARGYGASRFSFNTEEGRCPVCNGQGFVTSQMSFLPNVQTLCEACGGMRFDEETLSVKWKDKSIGEVLKLSVDEALELFGNNNSISYSLSLMQDVGLGYLKLGQPSTTLSGGEAQRIKLVYELSKAYTAQGKLARRCISTFYILDEPTVGLHMSDVDRLINVLHRLVDAGHTVLVIEHNLDVIAEADYIIDLGPEGGPAGGCIVGEGTPGQIAKLKTPTGEALAQFLSEHGEKAK